MTDYVPEKREITFAGESRSRKVILVFYGNYRKSTLMANQFIG